MHDEHLPGLSDAEIDHIRRESMEFAEIGLYRYKLDGTLIFLDRGAMKILGIERRFPDPRDLAGKNIEELIVYLDPKGRLRRKILADGHARNYEYHFKTLDGEERWALHDSYLVTDSLSGEQLIQVIVRDITERKCAEESISRAKRDAEFYLDLISHDLANFTQTALMTVEALDQAPLDGACKKLAEQCQRNLRKSANLIAKGRTFAMAQRLGEDAPERVELNGMLAASISTVQELHPKEKHRLRFELHGERFAAATPLLEHVFTNLIENAIVHGRKEAAPVRVVVKDSETCWEVRIEDEGSGVPDESKEAIFERYVRIREKKGMGLGLPLARQIMERIGGRIQVHDRVAGNHAAGSVFSVFVPKAE